MQFNDKVAAITGAGSGIGRALAQSLAHKGCHLALADINGANLTQTAEGLTDVKVSTHRLDVADKSAVYQFAADVVAEHGRVNMIFNNAGVSVSDTAEHMTYEDFQWLMNINFWGVVYGTKAFLPYLRQAHEAHIINTSSIFGTIALPSQSAYNASKFAVRGYTYALRQELGNTHIGVSCVQPGGVKTNIAVNSRYVPKNNVADTKEEMMARFDAIARLTSDQAAEQILRGVRKNKAQILVGKDAKLIAIIERIAPIGHQKLLKMLIGIK